ncbi:tripartite tricarboxylate transporter TctB family protein [Vibrio sp. 10N.286.49.C2]|uniref:tripartite tricarboxylate transporter TctB family protein n=1 Tax=unclassified Vibrio TaxID=2614977 RepID=UPI000C81B7EE|nr:MULTISPECIES: tripartite tricarboxylate transporter TctB family protein [unclassified Vibrio]PMH38107.1 tripartite tricarboxylate transporter TctB family protein [Vibrio sp. 10N.286.49.C2]PMH53687.1 tripartite tricarboxylate transporter TctB family protein [Vibrio sp. 10N.286.49.B1]PMH81949.1 tripartite tricarboxylate transporter TctB family protein [Vibrio sp. 10N.286.48.B7]
MKDRNIVFPSLMIIFSVLALVVISQFNEPRFQDASVDAKFFPMVVSIAIIIISIALMIQSKLKNSIPQNLSPVFTKLSIFGFCFLIGYAVLISFIGYLYATLFAFTFYLVAFKITKPLYYLIAWAFVFGIYYLFGEVFVISLPEGSLF